MTRIRYRRVAYIHPSADPDTQRNYLKGYTFRAGKVKIPMGKVLAFRPLIDCAMTRYFTIEFNPSLTQDGAEVWIEDDRREF